MIVDAILWMASTRKTFCFPDHVQSRINRLPRQDLNILSRQPFFCCVCHTINGVKRPRLSPWGIYRQQRYVAVSPARRSYFARQPSASSFEGFSTARVTVV